MVKCVRRVVAAGFLAYAGSLVFSTPSYAYLDPGTGSYVLQLLIGVLIGAAFAIRFYWKKIWSSLSNRLSRRKKNEKDAE
ncbi:MAG: hypothetical protein ABIJ00_04175 [Candidatus Eisenbacteria bacterium]